MQKSQSQNHFLLFIVSFLLISECYGGCGTYRDGRSGKVYNLDPLTTTTSWFVSPSDTDNHNGYYFNLCDFLPDTLITNSPTCQKDLTDSSSPCISVGLMPGSIAELVSLNIQKEGIVITYDNPNGPTGPDRFVVQIECVVDSVTTFANIVINQASSGDTFYTVQGYSSSTCPLANPPPDPHHPPSTKKGLSAGSILLITISCVIVVYFIAGSVINVKVRGAQPGREMIPNVSFWSELPGLVRDGCVFTFRKIFKRGGYSNL